VRLSEVTHPEPREGGEVRGTEATGAGWRRWGLEGGGGQTVTLAAIARNGQARGGGEMRSPYRFDVERAAYIWSGSSL
jgi:hypothetical protein